MQAQVDQFADVEPCCCRLSGQTQHDDPDVMLCHQLRQALCLI